MRDGSVWRLSLKRMKKERRLPASDQVSDSLVFHAGTEEVDGAIVSSGGRVIAFTSFGNTMAEALEQSYESLSKVHFDKMYYRRDIGFDLVVSKD